MTEMTAVPAQSNRSAEPLSLPGINPSAPNEVDKSPTSSDVSLDDLQMHFSEPIRQVYWQGASEPTSEYKYSFLARRTDGGTLALTIPFDPKVASTPVSVDFAKAGRFDLTERMPGSDNKLEWVALSGTATINERPDRVQIVFTALQLQGPNETKRNIAAGSIDGKLQRACYAQAQGSVNSADPVADEAWSSNFCRQYR